MIRRLVLLATLASLVLGACSSAAPSAGNPPAGETQGPATTSAPKATATPFVLAPAVPKAQLAPNGKVPPASMSISVSLWGAPQEVVDRTLKQAKDAGFVFVKQRFEWRYLDPKRRGRYEWDESDRLVDAVAKNGLGLIARVDNQPEWSRSDGIFPESGPPSDLEDWKDFLQDFCERYKGHIFAYELWNEPNLSREWAGNKPDAKAYTEMLKIGYAAVKQMDPDTMVISAGLSPTTENSAKAQQDLQFLKDMYAAGAKGSFDMLGLNAPGYKAEPEADPAKVAADLKLTNNDPSPVDAKRIYAFRHVEDMRKVMEENGDGAKQVAIMEFGYTTDPRPGSPYAWHAVTEEQRADYLVRAFKYAKQNWAAWIGPVSVIYLPDPAWTAKDEQFYWAITEPDGKARPSYDALKKYGTTK